MPQSSAAQTQDWSPTSEAQRERPRTPLTPPHTTHLLLRDLLKLGFGTMREAAAPQAVLTRSRSGRMAAEVGADVLGEAETLQQPLCASNATQSSDVTQNGPLPDAADAAAPSLTQHTGRCVCERRCQNGKNLTY